MADFLKLFMDRRLSPSEPHHLQYIKGRLAALQHESPQQYVEYSDFYGVDLSAPEHAPVLVEKEKEVEEEKPKKKVKKSSPTK